MFIFQIYWEGINYRQNYSYVGNNSLPLTLILAHLGQIQVTIPNKRGYVPSDMLVFMKIRDENILGRSH
jgi:hypothetical protein